MAKSTDSERGERPSTGLIVVVVVALALLATAALALVAKSPASLVQAGKLLPWTDEPIRR